MMILGIDFGKKKVGLAIGDTQARLASPLKVIRYEDEKTLVAQLKSVIASESIEKVVIGISEGEIEILAKELGAALVKDTNLELEYWDETLSTKDAQVLSIEAGIRRKKRKALEDAYSAALILQSFLDGLGY